MTSNFIDCPNNGKCGNYKHRVGSLAYKRCVGEKASATRKPAKTSGSAMGRPPSSTAGRPP